MDILSHILTIFMIWILALVFITLAGFVAVSIILTIWRLLYYLIHPIYAISSMNRFLIASIKEQL